MNTVFLIGSVQAVFFAILIYNKKEKTISDKVLVTWLLIFAVQLISPFLVYGNPTKFIHLGGADMPLIPAHAAMLLVYTQALIDKQNMFQKKWLIHTLPPIISFICAIPYYAISREKKILLYENKLEIPNFIYVFPAILVVVIVFYIIRTLQVIDKHKKDIHQEFSFEENINLTWLRNLVITMSALAFIIFASAITFKLKGMTLVQTDYVFYVGLVVFVYGIGYWGYKQGKIFVYRPSANNEEVTPKKRSSNNGNQVSVSKEDQSFINKLTAHMEKEKPFINNELNLYDLASALDVSSTYLSQILNTCLQLNFYQFVNKYRVEEAQRKIKNNEAQHFTLLTIAFESGFNSKASFNRIFKDISGMTPSEYQKSIA